ncbi:hypothetical protein [Halorubellus sp. PRR65]|uniref:hypothetical protein n=1 Tax=Halorubellus sp. PRR65 TaxID=3098148 RepID=UPI002B262E72|nr:hypothetical protein [Halorubellus sp. PRR65]
MTEAGRFERAGVVVGVLLVAVFVVALLGDVTATAARTPFAVVVLALGALAGVVAATSGVLDYETVWAFALGAWLVAVPLVSLAPEGRLAVLVASNVFLDDAGYRVLVLAVAGVGGAMAAAGYDRYA